MVLPSVIEKNGSSMARIDLFSKLLDKRIIMVSGPITAELSDIVVAELLYLESIDPEKEITMYIDSPGGDVIAGLAIYDTMNHIRCEIRTICVGLCASMGSVLLSSGTKGKRCALPNSEILIHQASGGMQGNLQDIMPHYKHLEKLNNKTCGILALNCNKSIEQIKRDTERDFWFETTKDAIEYGIIDKIIG
jgi:ATP-dependent Clp protease protease subunit